MSGKEMHLKPMLTVRVNVNFVMWQIKGHQSLAIANSNLAENFVNIEWFHYHQAYS